MSSQRMLLRKEPTPGGKGVKLPEKSNLLSPNSHHLHVSLLTAPQCKEEAHPDGREGKGGGGGRTQLGL